MGGFFGGEGEDCARAAREEAIKLAEFIALPGGMRVEAGVNESDRRSGLKSDEGAEVSFDGDLGEGFEGVGEGFNSLRIRS